MRKLGEREGVSSRNGNPWKIGEYLVEIPGQYPRHINFRVSDGQVGRLARFESMIGKTVTVSFDIDAHEHEGRWYNEINAWGIMEYMVGRKTPQTKVAPASPAELPRLETQAPGQGNASKGDENTEGGGDGLPF